MVQCRVQEGRRGYTYLWIGKMSSVYKQELQSEVRLYGDVIDVTPNENRVARRILSAGVSLYLHHRDPKADFDLAGARLIGGSEGALEGLPLPHLDAKHFKRAQKLLSDGRH